MISITSPGFYILSTVFKILNLKLKTAAFKFLVFYILFTQNHAMNLKADSRLYEGFKIYKK